MKPTAPTSSRLRPLSPHLQIYRIQLTSLLSITHRFAGIFLFGSAFMWCLYLLVWPSGKGEWVMHIAALRWVGFFFLAGFVFSFSYHLLNGIRHLVWDIGIGYALPSVYRSGWLIILGTCVLSGLSLWWIL